jgi:tetratricopeptide (TPR) repeat protein
MHLGFRAGCQWFVLLSCLLAVPAAAQQPTPDDMANQVLDAGRRAYNERNFPFAIERFKAFIQQYGGNKNILHARLGLGLAILESPTPDYQQAIDNLRPAADSADFAERPLAAFYLATGYRALGHNALVQAAQKPNEAANFKNQANQQFDQAAKAFDIAATGFAARVKEVPASGDLPSDLEWATRARLDQVEMLLRLNKAADALPLVEKQLAEKSIARSKYLGLARYYLGYAQYTGGKHIDAAKTLSQLAPFDDRAYGTHARYMLGRAHHLLGERVEASQHYEAIIAAYDEEMKLAAQIKQNAELLKNDPAERARLLIVGASPPPDYVARSWFYAGVLSYEQEKFSDALERFNQFATRYKTSPQLNEAMLRKGFCQVRMKQFQEAVTTLNPLADDPQLGDQARWWLGRAYAGLATTNPTTLAQNLNQAIEHYKKAAEKAQQRIVQDPTAKANRHDVLIELGDTHQQNKQANEAVAAFQQILNEQPDAERGELALQRLTAALHLAGKFKESDDACTKFATTFPKSLLLPAVSFRTCENALAVAEAAYANPQTPNREATLKPLYTEVLTRTEKFLKAHPESPDVNYIRHAAGLANYRLGQYEAAAGLLAKIDLADRSGDLASVSYLLADCLLRQAPETADDALAAGALLEQVGEVQKLLEGFIASNPQSPQVGDAMLKLADAYQRIASVISVPQEKAQTLQLARQMYEKIMQQFPAQQPVHALAVYERARCMLAQNDIGGAMNEYKRFEADPLRISPVAPMAILRYATLLRQQKRAAEAITPLQTARQHHEAALASDPQRAHWAPLLQYQHGIVLREANKLPEAQQMFENLVQRFPQSPEAADAGWRIQQCKREQVLLKLEPARVTLARIDAPANEVQAAKQVYNESMAAIAQIAQALEAHATALDAKFKGSDAQLSSNYEAAWCYRLLAQHELTAARDKMREEAQKNRQAQLAMATPPGRNVPKAALPDVPLDKIPVQTAEKKARAMYEAMIANGGESRLVPVARLELAEVYSQRDDFENSIKLLEAALNADPADQDLAERLRVRLAASYIGKGDGASAQAEVEAIAKNDKSPLWAEARFLGGEALSQQKKYAEAVELLKTFRDDGRLHNIPNISDRAMMRLAYAYEQLQQWEPARQAYETMFNRYAQSPWRMEARYGMGFCHQKMSQWDPAANQYGEVIKGTTQEVAARAQYNIGVCRQAQQRLKEAADAFQMCAYTYDYPELSAQALVDGAIALEAMKLVPDAAKLLQQVAKEYPSTKAAPLAAERLSKLPVQ